MGRLGSKSYVKPRVKPKFAPLAQPQRKKVAKIARNVVTNMAEKKYHDTTNTNQEGSYDNAVFNVINAVSQGSTDTSRNGDSLLMTSVDIRGEVSFANSAVGIGRLIVFMAKPGNSDLTSGSTVTYGLGDILSLGASSGATFDHYLWDSVPSRFQILYDRVFSNSDVGAASNNNRLHFHKTIGLKQKPVQYEAATTRISKNALYWCWMGNDTDASGNEPLLNIQTRLRFLDI